MNEKDRSEKRKINDQKSIKLKKPNNIKSINLTNLKKLLFFDFEKKTFVYILNERFFYQTYFLNYRYFIWKTFFQKHDFIKRTKSNFFEQLNKKRNGSFTNDEQSDWKKNPNVPIFTYRMSFGIIFTESTRKYDPNYLGRRNFVFPVFLNLKF